VAQRPPAASCTAHGDSGVNGSQMFDIVREMASVDHTCTDALTTAIYSVPVREQSANDAERLVIAYRVLSVALTTVQLLNKKLLK